MHFVPLALLVTLGAALPSPAPRAVSQPTIFFCPGAWMLPSGFDMVRADLGGRGFETSAIALPSVGSPNPGVGLPEDMAAVRTALTELVDAGKEVVLVAHSYGGEVSSGAVQGLDLKSRIAEGKTGGVSMLVYLAAFVVDNGSSLGAALGGGGMLPPWISLQVRWMCFLHACRENKNKNRNCRWRFCGANIRICNRLELVPRTDHPS
jgi:pimeloyl-ACP methyl ester carboxylesterase